MELQHIEFDSPFAFDGTVISDADDNFMYPSVYVSGENADIEIDHDQWSLIIGHSGQHGRCTGIMHPSEQLSWGMLRAMFDKFGPAIYSIAEVQDLDDMDNLVGWAILRHIG